MRVLFLLAVFCLTGCGYRLGQGGLRAGTITVPFVQGDDDGRLTSYLVRELSRSGGVRVVTTHGELTLQVKLLNLKNRTIGYRYDQKSCDCLAKSVIPTEVRKILEAEVIVVRGDTILAGPTLIEASYDYDFDYCQVKQEVNVFSLGQLVDIETAADSALDPLYRRLAEKVTTYVVTLPL